MSKINFTLLGALLFGIAAIICASVAWSRTSQLSLPFPAIIPALNILLSALTAFLFPISRRMVGQVKHRVVQSALPYLAHAWTLLPFILLILSLVYATPGDIQSCGLDRHWLRMFERKDSTAIRNIQTSLQCCGLNSIHDRAWPFPSRNTDARACELTQGYTIPCAEPWRREEVSTAILTALASFFNWLMVILSVINVPQEQGQIRLPAWSTSTRLIEGDTTAAERNADTVIDEGQSEQQRVWQQPQHGVTAHAEF